MLMLQLKNFGVFVILSISSIPTAILLILFFIGGLVQATKHIFVIHVRRVGIMSDHQSG